MSWQCFFTSVFKWAVYFPPRANFSPNSPILASHLSHSICRAQSIQFWGQLPFNFATKHSHSLPRYILRPFQKFVTRPSSTQAYFNFNDFKLVLTDWITEHFLANSTQWAPTAPLKTFNFLCITLFDVNQVIWSFVAVDSCLWMPSIQPFSAVLQVSLKLRAFRSMTSHSPSKRQHQRSAPCSW